MEKINYDEYLKKIAVYRSALDKFIWFRDVKLVVDEHAETCYFSPKERKVAIPLKWIEEWQLSLDQIFEELKMKFGVFHEFSHYRDMIKESDLSWNKSMLEIMTEMSKKKIEINEWWKIKTIPLGNVIRTLYNCIDDIVVNTEVGNYIPAEITLDAMKSVYQRSLFADYKKGEGNSDTSQNDERKLNMDEPVDYTKIPWYKALPYYFLRKYMVSDQEIILPDAIKSTLFNERWKPDVWSNSIRKIIKIFEKKLEESKTSNPRYASFEKVLKQQLTLLKNIDITNINTYLKKWLIDHIPNGTIIKTSSGSKMKWKDSLISASLSLEDIVGLLTITKGANSDHHLVVSPKVRYQIIQKIFEPILTTLIMMHLLDEDIPADDANWKGKWCGGTGNENGESWGKTENWEKSEWEGWRGWEKGEDSDKSEWKDLEGWNEKDNSEDIWGELWNRIRDLKDIIEYQDNKQKEEEKKNQAKTTWKSLSDILKNHGFSSEDASKAIKSLNLVIENFKEEIKEFTQMLEEELEKLELEYKKEMILARKWKRANYTAVRKELWNHYDDLDISRERIWEKKKIKEILEQEFKKLVFYFMLDVSWSTGQFRWDSWYLNWIAIALAVALHNVEQDIRKLIEDPWYTIPINFIIYANWAELITFKYNSFDEMLAEANYKIISLDGGTYDVDWWNKSAEKIITDFDNNQWYVEDIESDKMKAIVLQIADSDVTEEGVQSFKTKLRERYWDQTDELLKWIETKRLILWERRDGEDFITEEEYESKKNSSFPPVPIIDPKTGMIEKNTEKKIHVKISEIGIKKKSEITENVKKLFDNLFVDSLKKE